MKPRFCTFLVALSLVLCLASRADAKVQLQPSTAAAGSVVDLAFHVTNDRSDAFTKKVQVVFPGSPTFQSAQATSPAGWTSSVDELRGPVASVTFDAAKLEGSNSADFVITVTVPIAGDRAVFTVLQTYSDGQVTRWATDPRQSPNEPDLAPVLSITGGASTTTVAPVTPTTLTPADNAGDGLKMPSAGNILIALGVGVIIVLVLRSRRAKLRQK